MQNFEKMQLDWDDFGPSTLEVKTFGHILKRLGEPFLVLDPPFQRKYVWTEEEATNLILCIYCGGDVGRLVFNKRNENGTTKFLCVDGKQRLTTLQNFKENKFSVQLPGQNKHVKYEEMNEEQRQKFESALIAVRIYIADER
ncbi:hypothetical protein GMAR_ORF78 [Golden Marseillevirus]|uniref:hypothetical protein n=1 Tax=Golden Marseillevirus TaxID=1720526 RepID=UPI000877AA85|nr:hypothetical protein GMAR_ORF78 [Golden Marseillevirus]ALX27453.1 hypothetical protein GMAR_ORF78 [Golden Marseillevirus]